MLLGDGGLWFGWILVLRGESGFPPAREWRFCGPGNSSFDKLRMNDGRGMGVGAGRHLAGGSGIRGLDSASAGMTDEEGVLG